MRVHLRSIFTFSRPETVVRHFQPNDGQYFIGPGLIPQGISNPLKVNNNFIGPSIIPQGVSNPMKVNISLIPRGVSSSMKVNISLVQTYDLKAFPTLRRSIFYQSKHNTTRRLQHYEGQYFIGPSIILQGVSNPLKVNISSVQA